MRLYRALHEDEKVLNSHDRAFSVSKNKEVIEINIADEIYSHIIPSHKLETAVSKKVIYSFTDDINVALMFIDKDQSSYDRIGCIEVENIDYALINDNTELIKPVFRMSDWIDLATYIYAKNSDKEYVLNNTNYQAIPIPFINTLIPSRWGALSLASTLREYAVICKELTPTILTYDQISEMSKIKVLEEPNMYLCNLKKNDISHTIKTLKQNVQSLSIMDVKKKFIEEQIDYCKQIFKIE